MTDFGMPIIDPVKLKEEKDSGVMNIFELFESNKGDDKRKEYLIKSMASFPYSDDELISVKNVRILCHPLDRLGGHWVYVAEFDPNCPVSHLSEILYKIFDGDIGNCNSEWMEVEHASYILSRTADLFRDNMAVFQRLFVQLAKIREFDWARTVCRAWDPDDVEAIRSFTVNWVRSQVQKIDSLFPVHLIH